jgi:hypothetical protein
MKLRHLLIALVFPLAASAAVEDTTHASFHTYGLVNGPGDASRALVARRWHIDYKSVAGCVVTQELIDSAKTHNARTEALLVKRHGTDWRRHFEADIRAEAARQQYISKKLDSSAEIRSLRSKLKKDYNAPFYRFDFDERSKLYTVEVKAWDKKAGDYKTYYVLTAGLDRWELKRVA